MAPDISSGFERQGTTERTTAFRSEDWLEPIKSFVCEHGTELVIGGVGTAAVIAASRFGLGAPVASAVRSATGYLEEVGARFGIQPWRSAQTYMFDLDRTLIDTDHAFGAYHSTLRSELLAQSGLSPSILDAGIAEAEKATKSVFIGDGLQHITPLAQAFPGQDVNVLFAGANTSARSAYATALQPRADVLRMLDTLKAGNRRIVSYTGGSPAHTVDKLDMSGLSKYFDRVYASGRHPFEDVVRTPQNMPSPTWDKLVELSPSAKATVRGFEEVAQHEGTKLRTVMVGDHIREDVLHAQQAGFKAAQATWFRRQLQDGVNADFVLKQPADVLKINLFRQAPA